MSRTTIEEAAFLKFKRVAHVMKLCVAYVAGVVATMWHHSQTEEKINCSSKDISFWTELKRSLLPKFIEGCLDAGFLERIGEDLYRIKGNEDHINNLRRYRESARKGGLKSAENRNGKQALQADAQANASPNAQANAQAFGQPTLEPNSVHSSAVHPNSTQFNPEQSNAVQSENGSLSQSEGFVEDRKGNEEQDKDFGWACRVWEETLEHYQIKRPLLEEEKNLISEKLKELGLKKVLYALTGYRFEASGPGYDPASYVRIGRALGPEKLDLWINLALQAKDRETNQDPYQRGLIESIKREARGAFPTRQEQITAHNAAMYEAVCAEEATFKANGSLMEMPR